RPPDWGGLCLPLGTAEPQERRDAHGHDEPSSGEPRAAIERRGNGVGRSVGVPVQAPRRRATLFDFMATNSVVAEPPPAAPAEPGPVETPPVAADGRKSPDLFASGADGCVANVPVTFASGEKAKAQ